MGRKWGPILLGWVAREIQGQVSLVLSKENPRGGGVTGLRRPPGWEVDEARAAKEGESALGGQLFK